MAIYFSPSTNGFYDSAISSKIPADAVEITVSDHRALIEAQAAGQVIQPGSDGRPQAVTVPVVSNIKATAQELLETNDRTAVRILKSGGSWPPAWQAYDEALREVIRGAATSLPTEPAVKPWAV